MQPTDNARNSVPREGPDAAGVCSVTMWIKSQETQTSPSTREPVLARACREVEGQPGGWGFVGGGVAHCLGCGHVFTCVSELNKPCP